MDKKLRIVAEVKPIGHKFYLVFYQNQKVRHIQEFIDNKFKKYGINYKVGRIEKKNNNCIIMSDFLIGDVLINDEEIIIYSIEYGLTKKSLDKEYDVNEANSKYIGKKRTRRDFEKIKNSEKDNSLKDLIKKSKESQSDDENENENKENDNNSSQSSINLKKEKDSNNTKKDEDEDSEDESKSEKKEDINKNNEEDDSSSVKSGSDKSQDIPL